MCVATHKLACLFSIKKVMGVDKTSKHPYRRICLDNPIHLRKPAAVGAGCDDIALHIDMPWANVYESFFICLGYILKAVGRKPYHLGKKISSFKSSNDLTYEWVWMSIVK